MNDVPIRFHSPTWRETLLSMGVRNFNSEWMLRIRCACGRDQEMSLPKLTARGLPDHHTRTLGVAVLQLRCGQCGQKPVSVMARDPIQGISTELLSEGEQERSNL